MLPNHYERFQSTILNLTDQELRDEQTLRSKLSLIEQDKFQVCYTPFEYINTSARLIIVGITPGIFQMTEAVAALREQLRNGVEKEAALKATKLKGAFSGPLRKNLVKLLNASGFCEWLGVSDADRLFNTHSHLVQTTSTLRNAVFYKGENYNGRSAKMLLRPFLVQEIMDGLVKDLRLLPNAVVLPLGDIVDEALGYLVQRGHVSRDQVLPYIPHPAGSNNGPISHYLKDTSGVFAIQRKRLQDRVQNLTRTQG